MLDKFNRQITYLRISVTDKCNLRCTYCMPPEGINVQSHDNFLSFEEIVEVVKAGVRLGINKIRLTGGEPLVKRGIIELVRMIKRVNGVEHLAMTTNGTLVEQLAAALKQAGLDSINISLDTLDGERYRRLTRGGDINRVFSGIQAVLEAGFPLKLNTVVLEDTHAEEITKMENFCRSRGIKLQLINHYSLTEQKKNNYSFNRPPDCSRCNRLRLLAGGELKPCLHSDIEIKVDFNNIEASLLKAVAGKPEKGSACSSRNMIEIGG